MKVSEIIEIIENKVPKHLAYDWDNVGLLIGNSEKKVKSVFITLDTNLSTVKEAISHNADMIISHHPIFFSPLKRIEYGTHEGDMIKLLIKNDISLYAAHTNMDTANGGINDKLAKLLNLSDIKVLEENPKFPGTGLGRYGNIKSKTLSEFVEFTKSILNSPVRFTGDENKMINTVAVASGACSELVPVAIKNCCDVLITADMKYHQMIDANEAGLCIIDAGHYPTEICVMDIFEEILSDTNLNIIKSKNKDIFKFSF